MTLLAVSAVSKSFAATPVLHEVSFQASEGEIVCLLGPSGCGKTTLLRIVAGLEVADEGQITFDGLPLVGVAVHRRGFGLMFQDFALFPHKDVRANVAFGLRMQDLPKSQIEQRVAEVLDLVGLSGYEQRRVYDLSGGEQQRVALARSLAPGPRLLMLDEPLGSLDRALREELLNELRAILKGVGVTVLYVTHDQQEAFALADRVLIMRRGRIVQRGSPQAVYHHPNSVWVARFLGLTNLVPGQVVAHEPLKLETPLGQLSLAEQEQAPIGTTVTLLIRPNAARLGDEELMGRSGLVLRGSVGACSFRGGHYRLTLQHPSGLELTFELKGDMAALPEPGQPVTLELPPEAIDLLPDQRNLSPEPQGPDYQPKLESQEAAAHE
jgi:ABC-type Fe3+/spermidine/putrescine transport system ATPase subunit